MTKIKKTGRILEADLRILELLYKFRALSTSQVFQLSNYSQKYIYEKLSTLRKKGYIITAPIKGSYLLGQTRQGNYHRLGERGIRLLKENGFNTVLRADSLRVRRERLPYILSGHDFVIPLIKQGWIYKDSREVKRLYNLNRGDILHGTLTTPDKTKEYLIYIMLQSVQSKTLRKIKSEIKRIPVESAILIARGKKSFDSVITNFTDASDKLIVGGSLKVMPLQFAKTYLGISSDITKNHQYFLKQLGINIIGPYRDKNTFGVNIDFDYLVEYKGEEMFFMDLLDNDLMKIFSICEYRQELYNRIGRRVLVLTSPSEIHKRMHEALLSSIQHITYLPVNVNSVISFANQILF